MAYDYEFLTTETVADYIHSKPELRARIDADHLVSVDEIGDGNLNLVFITRDEQGRGLCLKQALPYVRMTGEGWPLTPERGRFEADSLYAHHELIPEHVVRLFDYDSGRYILAMEDLSDHRVWRGAFNEGLVYENAATAVGRYIGAVAFGTSPLSMERGELAAQQRASVNPELCQITEDLVLTEPSVDVGRNHTIAANTSDAIELSEDKVFSAAMARAKWNFMTQGEALIHGDLHTASVMVRAQNGSNAAESVKVFDSEFAFYGPVAYDIGLIWANYCIAAARAYALDDDERAEWALDLPRQTWQALEEEFRGRWPRRRVPGLWGDNLLEGLLHTWQEQAWIFAAAEMSRRIVGAAKTTDIETLPENLREGAARGVLRAARQMVRACVNDSNPEAFSAIADEKLRANRTPA